MQDRNPEDNKDSDFFDDEDDDLNEQDMSPEQRMLLLKLGGVKGKPSNSLLITKCPASKALKAYARVFHGWARGIAASREHCRQQPSFFSPPSDTLVTSSAATEHIGAAYNMLLEDYRRRMLRSHDNRQMAQKLGGWNSPPSLKTRLCVCTRYQPNFNPRRAHAPN